MEVGRKGRKEERSQEASCIGSPQPILSDEEMLVLAGFRALFQGDHLGVEVATDSHSNLLADAGLLLPVGRLRSDIPVADDVIADGLVIDDYFVLSKEENNGRPLEESKSVEIFEKAKRVYAREGILGSEEKDVRGELNFKVCGAEIDSSVESVSRGVVSAGVPLEKRMNLAMLSASIATLPYTSDALRASLVGSWTSTLMMRRPVFSVINELLKVIAPEELSMEKPLLRFFFWHVWLP